MESTPPQVLAMALCAFFLLTEQSLASPLPGEAQQLPSDNFLPSELTVSVLVNQKIPGRTLNNSSIACSSHEAAIAELNARQEDAKEELRRSLETALMTIQEKKEEALDEVIRKKEQTETELASIKESPVNEPTEIRQIIIVLNATEEGTMPRKIFQKYMKKSYRNESMDACKRLGGRLAVPENEEENAQLSSMINDGSGEKVYWIGVDDKAQEGVWVDSNTDLPLTFINFDNGQPGGGGEDCGAMKSHRTGWHDYPCDHRLTGYLCEIIIAVA